MHVLYYSNNGFYTKIRVYILQNYFVLILIFKLISFYINVLFAGVLLWPRAYDVK